MVTLAFDLAPGEKLDYTFDFSADLDAITAIIEGSPVITISPASPALTLVSTTVLTGDKKVAVVLNHSVTDKDQEWSVECKINATTTPDRDFKQGIYIRAKPTPPAATNGLTTVARIITELAITDATKQALVADYINEATSLINSFCNRTFYREAGIVEKQAGYGNNILQVDKTPLISIASITADGTTVPSTDYEIHDAAAGQIYAEGGWWHTGRQMGNASRTLRPGSEQKLYTVTYTGGYILPGTSGRTLPHDIERACIELVRSLMNARTDPSIKSESVPGVYSVEYGDANAEFGSIPANVAKMLSPYRRVLI